MLNMEVNNIWSYTKIPTTRLVTTEASDESRINQNIGQTKIKGPTHHDIQCFIWCLDIRLT